MAARAEAEKAYAVTYPIALQETGNVLAAATAGVAAAEKAYHASLGDPWATTEDRLGE